MLFTNSTDLFFSGSSIGTILCFLFTLKNTNNKSEPNKTHQAYYSAGLDKIKRIGERDSATSSETPVNQIVSLLGK